MAGAKRQRRRLARGLGLDAAHFPQASEAAARAEKPCEVGHCGVSDLGTVRLAAAARAALGLHRLTSH